MDKSCQSSGDSTITSSSSSNNNNANNNTNRDPYLKHLNKLSHKISKPTLATNNTGTSTAKRPPFDHDSNQPFNHSTADLQQQEQHQRQQPPVYNINKNDFRDVVQRLTGSPAHEKLSTPPPIHPPKPPSSRLQRIRPPPLAQVTNAPPPSLNSAATLPLPQQQQQQPVNTAINPHHASAGSTSAFVQPSPAPLSPLPPFPAAHAGAAESPVSAYMRYLQTSISTADSKNPQVSGLSPVAPRWNNRTPPPPQFTPAQQGIIPPPTTAGPTIASQTQFQLPTSLSPFGSFNWPHSPYGLLSPSVPQAQFPLPASPAPFGCLNSPRSPYGFLSPSLLLSPSAFPLSPTVPVPSPRWRGL